MKAWTDYPITELGDKEGEIAPVRECDVRSYDGDKYCLVDINGITKTIKAGYIYSSPGSYGEVPSLTRRKLHQLRIDTIGPAGLEKVGESK